MIFKEKLPHIFLFPPPQALLTSLWLWSNMWTSSSNLLNKTADKVSSHSFVQRTSQRRNITDQVMCTFLKSWHARPSMHLNLNYLECFLPPLLEPSSTGLLKSFLDMPQDPRSLPWLCESVPHWGCQPSLHSGLLKSKPFHLAVVLMMCTAFVNVFTFYSHALHTWGELKLSTPTCCILNKVIDGESL